MLSELRFPRRAGQGPRGAPGVGVSASERPGHLSGGKEEVMKADRDHILRGDFSNPQIDSNILDLCEALFWDLHFGWRVRQWKHNDRNIWAWGP